VWIVTAWHFISPAVTVQGFKKYSTFNAVDGTDDVLWNGSEEHGNVTSKRDEATDCDDGDSDTEWYR
jgi:hypothetical protein